MYQIWEAVDTYYRYPVNIMLNVTPIFRIGVGASYRAVESLSLPELTNRDLSGWSGNIQFKFGKFIGT